MKTHYKRQRAIDYKLSLHMGLRTLTLLMKGFFMSRVVRGAKPWAGKEGLNRKVAGFSLTEMLIVVAMLGMTMGAVFSMYQTHTKAAYTEEEMAEVQQNLRVVVDRITQDISMAGFLVPTTLNPIDSAGNNTGPNGTDTITINTATASSVSARIIMPTQDVTFLASGDPIDLSVSELSGFEPNDVNNAVVTIVSSQGSVQGVSTTFTVTAVKDTLTGSCGVAASPCLTLSAKTPGTGTITRGDMIVNTGAALFPNSITYSVITGGLCPVGQNCIAVNGQIIANNIAGTAAGLQITYLLDGGTEVEGPADFSQVRAVRVNLAGQNVVTTAYMGGQAKIRNLTSVAMLRNR